MVAKNKSNEIQIARVYDAPVKAVWDAWTDPEQVGKWWGPRGFTITTHGKELKPGGFWHYTMHGPDGTDYENKTHYFEVEKHAKLVYDHGGNDERKPLFRVTVLFKEENGKTKTDMTMSLPTPEAAAETRKFIKQAGGDSTWDRLGEYLDKELFDKEDFIINRVFDAPISTMFEMWMNPEHLSKWLPPTGFEMEMIRSDLKPGGSSFYVMTNHKDVTMYGRIQHLDISKPHLIVSLQQFCDEKENISRHPKIPVWPETMRRTVRLREVGPEQTLVTVEWQPEGKTSREELEAFINLRGSMTQGWTGSFDKLESLLEES